MEIEKRKVFPWILAMALTAGILTGGAAAGWYWMFGRPYCVYEDCRGCEIDVETMRRWEEQAKEGNLGIIRMAGWRTGREQTVTSISTGRKRRAEVTWVYGSMELAETARLLRGRFGLAVEENYCVISEELARNLFGSTEVVGECVKTEDGKMNVAGVIEKKGEILMVPAADGRVEYLSVEFDSRAGAWGKIKRLLEEY